MLLRAPAATTYQGRPTHKLPGSLVYPPFLVWNKKITRLVHGFALVSKVTAEVNWGTVKEPCPMNGQPSLSNLTWHRAWACSKRCQNE
eukprot:1463277-Amphidinium_carterae.1